MLCEGSPGNWLGVVREAAVADDGVGVNWELGALDVAVEAALPRGGVGANAHLSPVEGAVALDAGGCDAIAFLGG